MNIFEITIQRKLGATWPIVVEGRRSGVLPVRVTGQLTIDGDLLLAQADPREYGQILGQALFRDHLRDAFTRALSAADDDLHVLLFVEDDGAKSWRWERLCAPMDGDWSFLALDQRTPFSLYLPSAVDRLFPPIGRRDLQALIIAASPSGLSQYGLAHFDVTGAVDCVRAAMDGIPHEVLAPVEQVPDAVGPPTLDELARRITASPITLLHFVCHGQFQHRSGETVLFLEGADGGVEPVTASRLVERLRTTRGVLGLPHFTFLSTCESAAPEAEGAMGGLAQRLVRDLGMPAVVAMTGIVSVDTAQALASEFYRRLQGRGEPDLALAQATAGLAGRPDVTVPALYSRLGGRPLFSDSLDRALTDAEIFYGMERLQMLLPERAPALQSAFNQQFKTLRSVLGIAPAALSEEARTARSQTLAGINALCEEATDLSFNGLALGQKPPAYDSRRPFQGLVAFIYDERAFFFGREALIADLQQRLDEHPFLAVLGPSGSGKSSLVLAGLIPALEARHPDLAWAVMTPGSVPLANLDQALTFLPGDAPLLVVDQFEELFTISPPEDREAFVARLLSLAETHLVVLTMRADFWGACASYPALRDQMQAHQELIAPMGMAELRSAMDQQAATTGLRFEADLANTLLDDVQGEPGAMPLLQHALLELWKRRHGRWLKAEEYRELGGVREAIARTADDVYEQAASEEQAVIHRLFLRLVRLDTDVANGDPPRDTSQRVAVDELVTVQTDLATLIPVVDKLASARLLVTSVNVIDGRQEVEIAHDALIQHWGRLDAWLADDRAGLLIRQQLNLAARTWRERGRDSALLYRGSLLTEANRWARERPDQINLLEREFLEQSVRHQRRQKMRWVGLATPVPLFVLAMLTLGFLHIPILPSEDTGWDPVPTWREVAGETGLYAPVVAVDAEDVSVIYAADRSKGGFYRSDNGGESWSNIAGDGLTESVVRGIALTPTGKSLYIATSTGVYASQDRGQTWTAMTPQPPFDNDARPLGAIAVSPNDDGWLWVGVWHDGVWSFDPDKQRWRRVAALVQLDESQLIRSLAAASQDILYAVTDKGLFASENGDTWIEIDAPGYLAGASLLSVALDSQDEDGSLFVGARGSGAWKVQNDAWTPLSRVGDLTSFAFSINAVGDNLYLGSSIQGLLYRRTIRWWEKDWWMVRLGRSLTSDTPSSAEAHVVEGMAWAPPGEFEMGTVEEARLVYLPGFYVDRFEVTLSAYCQRYPTHRLCNSLTEGQGSLPVANITQARAERYCQSLDKTLPTGMEWEKAARGLDGREFPWGDRRPDSELANIYLGAIQYYGGPPRPVDDVFKRTVGSYSGGESPYGAKDMAGNVWEMVAEPHERKELVIRGGAFNARSHFAVITNQGVFPRPFDDTIGFRCVRQGE